MKALDKLLNRFISKKLTVFIIATIFMFLSKITSENWVEIVYIYIIGQSLVDVMKTFRK